MDLVRYIWPSILGSFQKFSLVDLIFGFVICIGIGMDMQQGMGISIRISVEH